MTKTSIENSLVKATGKYMITKDQLSKVCGYGKEYCAWLLNGVDFVRIGNSKRYLVGDIAARIMEVKEA